MTAFRVAIAQRLLAPYEQQGIEWATAYGDPGHDEVLGVIMANWNNIPRRIGDILEKAGWGCEWSDEWSVCGQGKAWRMSPDSYFWQPNAVVTNDGELITRDDDPSVWIEEMQMTDKGHPYRTLPEWITDADLAEAGFVREPDEELESGWFPGQNDDPKTHAKAAFDKGAEAVVFRKTEQSQFYSKWECWVRMPEAEEQGS
jgi:hypothetical protein